jgi:hypothetical protein
MPPHISKDWKMQKPHEGHVELRDHFVDVHTWLTQNGSMDLATRDKTEFEAKAATTQTSNHRAKRLSDFFKREESTAEP